MNIVNSSAYKFVRLEKIKSLQVLLKAKGDAVGIKGTVLLGEEGINLSLAGEASALDAFQSYLASFPEFSELPYKNSYSRDIPFKKFVVKCKPEIVTIKNTEFSPSESPGDYIEAKTLKQWLDEGKKFHLLDTRNQFEAEFGGFDGATVLPIEHFSEFPEAITKLDESWKDKEIVTYCTGGIRCEKAVLAMRAAGFNRVYQLAGGILKYFEECGGAHYHGECFVFDDRVALDAKLAETTTARCKQCCRPIFENAVCEGC